MNPYVVSKDGVAIVSRNDRIGLTSRIRGRRGLHSQPADEHISLPLSDALASDVLVGKTQDGESEIGIDWRCVRGIHWRVIDHTIEEFW